ncbi:hypothetical protein [Clostridium coskatii]|uniref:Uncharacterized protein n=1 Tax=Clostridium coskatii TaxID=1705578 RepID=A0A162NB98_9CLOT|nr:hypothetical protein [Clostridium coskatii]OAA91319.1 hypothetical protein WX73_01729 [Clostridium coskatii]OBR93951.1 hypothetical protein CLCOS_20870 [Clostridium coskatii]
MSKTLLNTLKNVVNGTIEREYMKVTDDFQEVLKKNTNLAKEHREYSDKVEELSEKLSKVVPEEYKSLIDDLVDASTGVMSAESEILFKEGVVLGATGLNYLSEIGTYLQFI